MEEKYKGYTIEYNEERSIFEAREDGGKHKFVHAELKELRRKIDRQAAHDQGFKKFEAWYFEDPRVRRVRVTSVNREEPRYGFGPERNKPIYRVRISYLDRVEDEYGQRNEVEHTKIFAQDPSTTKRAEELKKLVDEWEALRKKIDTMAEGIPRLRPEDLGIKGG